MLDVPNNRKLLPPSPWTDVREAILRRGWDDGLTCGQIANELNCGFSRNAVIGKATRLKLPKRRDAYVRRAKQSANNDRSATMRIKTLKVRGPSNGGAVVVESVVREELPQRADFLGIALLDLDADQCRYPRGGDNGVPITFCGQTKLDGQSYCRHCSRIVYQPSIRPVLRPYYATGRSKPAVF